MTSEEKLTRIMNGVATPEHRIEMLRELIADEVAKQLQKPPIPGPSDQTEIIPAEPLREMPEDDKMYVYVAEYQDQSVSLRQFFSVTTLWLEAGRVFPYTLAGMRGAELRAKEGIVPYPVQPAKALTEPLEEGDMYWFTDGYGQICANEWEVHKTDHELLSEGRIFPHNLRGKLGAAMFQEPKPE